MSNILTVEEISSIQSRLEYLSIQCQIILTKQKKTKQDYKVLIEYGKELGFLKKKLKKHLKEQDKLEKDIPKDFLSD